MEVTITNLEHLQGDKNLFIDWSDLKNRKVNKERAVFGEMRHHVAIDSTYMASMNFYVKQGGEYRKMSFRLPEKNFCQFFMEDIYFYRDIAEASDFP